MGGSNGTPGRSIPGAAGTPGQGGARGERGPRGPAGPQGVGGIKGVPGEPGESVEVPRGPRGPPGPAGAPGVPGEAAQNIQLNPYIVAFHSQKNQAPECLPGMTKLWEGYSFMFVDADSKNKWSQNLGDAGS